MKKLLIGAAIVALTGCANWQQVANDAIDTAYIIEVNKGISQIVLQANLSQQENETIILAEKKMLELGDHLLNIKDEPSKIIMLDATIEVAASQYSKAKAVVLAHESEYELYDWEGLAALDSRLNEMYQRYQEFKRQQDYSNAATQLGEYAKLAAKLAIIYGA